MARGNPKLRDARLRSKLSRLKEAMALLECAVLGARNTANKKWLSKWERKLKSVKARHEALTITLGFFDTTGGTCGTKTSNHGNTTIEPSPQDSSS